MLDVQDEVGRRVVEVLHSRVVPAAPKSRDRYTSNPNAYNEFISGLGESFAKRPETLKSAVQYLSKAVERDPEFALAHATLSHVCMILDFEFEPQRQWLEKAEHHCRRALALDPGLPEGHLARAWILWSPAKTFQHVEAIAELEQVLASRPNLERAHNRMSTSCWLIGRLNEHASRTSWPNGRIRRRRLGICGGYIWLTGTSRAWKWKQPASPKGA